MAAHRERAKVLRSLQAMTWGQIVADKQRERDATQLEGGEMSQHVTVDIAGKATPKISRQEVTVSFEYGFATSFGQGDTEVEEPIFTPGVILRTDADVFVQPQVREWIEDDSGFIVGARIRILHYAPGVLEPASFRATIHLQFAGWAVPVDTSDDEVAGQVAGETAPAFSSITT
jgi:hypothetical protein